MFHIPLLIVPFILYNLGLAGFLGSADGGPWAQQLFSVSMMSGGVWSMTLADGMIVIALALLFFEIMKSTRTSNASVIDHLLSTFVFVAFLVEFLLVRGAATSLFFVLMAISLVDVLAGFFRLDPFGQPRRQFPLIGQAMRNLQLPGRSAVIAENGMAATAHPLATATAISVLKDGGNAADAALAASATLAVVEPSMTGIGGDCFVILAEPDGAIHGLNGSGRAPSRSDAAWYRDAGHTEIPQTGAHAITVPGAVKAWQALSDRFGTMELTGLFADAIRYGEGGFAVHHRVAADWAMNVDALAGDEGGRLNCLRDGKAPAFGSRFHFPALAGTLRRIAAEGADAFYSGEIAEEIARTVAAGGGFLNEDDLAVVSADWVDPISVSYGGYDIHEIPPNGQGITALIMLRLMEAAGSGSLKPGSAERYHLEIEMGRLAYSVRDALVSDPDHMNVASETLLSDAFCDSLAADFDPARRNGAITLPPVPDADTTYLTVVDRDRMAVSFINSLYNGFGSKVVTPKSGIALQNRGACFTLEEGHPNELKPGKRPMHTIIPAMATKNGRPAVSFGVMGGAYQPMGHAHVFSNLADHGMDPQAAIDHPRLFWAEDGTLEAEAGIGGDVRKGLEARGHTVRDAAMPLGGGQMIVIDEESGFLIAGSDPRKDGLALGW